MREGDRVFFSVFEVEGSKWASEEYVVRDGVRERIEVGLCIAG